MPTLFRFLFWSAAIFGLGYAIVFSLANFVTPSPREKTIAIPSERLNPPDIAAPATATQDGETP